MRKKVRVKFHGLTAERKLEKSYCKTDMRLMGLDVSCLMKFLSYFVLYYVSSFRASTASTERICVAEDSRLKIADD